MKEHVHFIGIGGTGISAIARLMLEQGYKVSGSDRALSPLGSALKADGADVRIGHDEKNVTGAEWVVRSSAIPDSNPEVIAAREHGIPVYKRSDFLGKLMQPPKIGVTVAGTHGKTTTTAMIAFTLIKLGVDPSYIIGANLLDGTNAHAGNGAPFVIEADEYDRMFLGLAPKFAIITNVEHDHPDIYPTQSEYIATFEKFAQMVPADGALIGDSSNAGVLRLFSSPSLLATRKIYYGTTDSPAPSGEHLIGASIPSKNPNKFSYAVQYTLNGVHSEVVLDLLVPGIHNMKNALATLAVCSLLGHNIKESAEALSGFIGTDRRFNTQTLPNGLTLVNDYAHHPTEIQATLQATRQKYPNARVWAVWQPHTYSRAKTLFHDFARSFYNADRVIVSKIYASREAEESFSAELIVEQTRHPAIEYIPELSDITQTLIELVHPNDVVIVMSAGDADRIIRDLAHHYSRKEADA